MEPARDHAGPRDLHWQRALVTGSVVCARLARSRRLQFRYCRWHISPFPHFRPFVSGAGRQGATFSDGLARHLRNETPYRPTRLAKRRKLALARQAPPPILSAARARRVPLLIEAEKKKLTSNRTINPPLPRISSCFGNGDNASHLPASLLQS